MENTEEEIKSYIESVEKHRRYDKPEINLNLTRNEIRSGFEKIGTAFALIHEDVPIVDKTLQKELYRREFESGKEPRIDYVDLDTSEYVLDPDDKDESIITYLKHNGQISWTGRSSIAPGVKVSKIIEKEREKRKKHFEYGKGVKSDILSSSEVTQSIAIQFDLDRIFNENSKEYEYLQDSVSSNPDKKWLVIFGHGGARWTLDGKLPKRHWNIGEQVGKLNTSLDDVMFRMMSNEKGDVMEDKYSAIVLISCNVSNLKPPKIEGSETPIFYVDGLAGGHRYKKTKVI